MAVQQAPVSLLPTEAQTLATAMEVLNQQRTLHRLIIMGTPPPVKRNLVMESLPVTRRLEVAEQSVMEVTMCPRRMIVTMS